jgi:ankyrin repeat protein
MKKLKNLTIFCLAMTLTNFIAADYMYTLPEAMIKELEYKQLLLAIQNTPNPSPELLANWLKMAFNENYEDIIRYILLNTHININYQDELGNTWLHYAVLLENPEFVKILLQKNIDRNKQNIFGDTALHHNIKYNPNLKIIKLLLMAGVNPDIRNNDEETALYMYITNYANPNEKIIRMLKKHCMCYFL